MRGDCFEAAFGAQIEDSTWTLVHGVATGGPTGDMRISHAWVEREGIVYDNACGRDRTLPRELYYRVGRIRDDQCRRYTADEAAEQALTTGHYGPWHDCPGIGIEAGTEVET